MAMTIDELQVLITAETKQLKGALSDVSQQLDGVGNQASQASSMITTSFNKIGAAATLALKGGVLAGVAAIAASIPNAVKRIDTLNNSARTFENMGFETQKSAQAVDALNKSIIGLPTPLDSAIRGMTALSATYGDVELGQKVFTSLNNAILGFGGSAAMVDNAILQLSQRPMDGPLDAQTWNSLLQSGLTPVLVAMAKDMGMSVGQMKEAFGSGQLTVQDFTNKLVEMNVVGGGGLKSLQQIAQDSTAGIGTGFENMKTAIARGVAAIIEAIGSANIATSISNIGKAFEGLLIAVAGLVTFIVAHGDIFGPMAVGIAAAVAAIIAYNTYVKLSAAITVAWTTASAYMALVAGLQAQGLGLLRSAWMALNIMMLANPIGLVIVAVVAITAALAYFFTQTETGRRIFETAMNGIKVAAEAVWNWIKANWPMLLAILTGPIGIAAGLIIRNADSIRQGFVNAWNAIKGAWSAATGFFSGIVGNIRNVVSGGTSSVTQSFSSSWSGIRGIWSAATGFFSGVVNGIVGAVSSIPSRMAAIFSNALNSIRNMNWTGLGKNIVDGIANGLNPNVIVGRMKNIASSAMDTVKSFLGINSPSRVMRDEVGKMMGKGMAIGIDSSTRDAVRSASNSAKDVLGAYSGSFNSNLPSSSQLSSKLDMSLNTRLPKLSGRQTPVNVLIDGDRIISFVIDGINNKGFMANNTVIEY